MSQFGTGSRTTLHRSMTDIEHCRRLICTNSRQGAKMRFMGRLQDNPLFVFGVSAAIAALLLAVIFFR